VRGLHIVLHEAVLGLDAEDVDVVFADEGVEDVIAYSQSPPYQYSAPLLHIPSATMPVLSIGPPPFPPPSPSSFPTVLSMSMFRLFSFLRPRREAREEGRPAGTARVSDEGFWGVVCREGSRLRVFLFSSSAESRM
jgi:hypothetical protein